MDDLQSYLARDCLIGVENQPWQQHTNKVYMEGSRLLFVGFRGRTSTSTAIKSIILVLYKHVLVLVLRTEHLVLVLVLRTEHLVLVLIL